MRVIDHLLAEITESPTCLAAALQGKVDHLATVAALLLLLPLPLASPLLLLSQSQRRLLLLLPVLVLPQQGFGLAVLYINPLQLLWVLLLVCYRT